MPSAILCAVVGRSRPRRWASPTAFTLLELLTVLGVIAVLAALSVGSTAHALRNRALRAKAQAELAVLATALEDFRRHHGEYPRIVSADALFAALTGRCDAANGVLTVPVGPFLAPDGLSWADASAEAPGNVVLDPWGRAYRYGYVPGPSWRAPGYVLYSTGPDGEAGAHSDGLAPGRAGSDADNVYPP